MEIKWRYQYMNCLIIVYNIYRYICMYNYIYIYIYIYEVIYCNCIFIYDCKYICILTLYIYVCIKYLEGPLQWFELLVLRNYNYIYMY